MGDNQETNKNIVYEYELRGNLANSEEYRYNFFNKLKRTISYHWKVKL